MNLYNPLIARKSHRPRRSYHIPDLIIGMDLIIKVGRKSDSTGGIQPDGNVKGYRERGYP